MPCPELSAIRGIKGVLSPFMVSPPLKIGESKNELGELVISVYVKTVSSRDESTWSLEPVKLNGGIHSPHRRREGNDFNHSIQAQGTKNTTGYQNRQ